MNEISDFRFKNKKQQKIRIEYETLIEETKVVVNESEKQYNQLIKALEIEKLAKDSIQVEMNVLEEKYENTIKSLNVDFETKVLIYTQLIFYAFFKVY